MAEYMRGIKAGIIAGIVYIIISAIYCQAFGRRDMPYAPGIAIASVIIIDIKATARLLVIGLRKALLFKTSCQCCKVGLRVKNVGCCVITSSTGLTEILTMI